MSADFWAGYLSGVVGIIVGNPLDIIKLRLQTQNNATPSLPTPQSSSSSSSALVKGTAAPILGYGALNALLFVSYNRCEAALNQAFSTQNSLWATWLAGAAGGLATCIVSAPTELIKCRAQMSTPAMSSWAVARQTWRAEGVRGLYFGGLVTALRDSIGYGFYFWAYELANGYWPAAAGDEDKGKGSLAQDAPKILLYGGLAGIVTWASVFPLDVVKSRVQTQAWGLQPTTTTPLLPDSSQAHVKPSGAWQVAKDIYKEGGFRLFFRGLTICSARAFVVNAVQWAVYEGIMHEMGQGRRQRAATLDAGGMAI